MCTVLHLGQRQSLPEENFKLGHTPRQTMGAAQGGTRGVSQRARSPQDRIDIRSCRRCDAAELAAVRLGFLPLSRTGAGFPDHSPHHPSYPATSGLRSRPGTQNANALTSSLASCRRLARAGASLDTHRLHPCRAPPSWRFDRAAPCSPHPQRRGALLVCSSATAMNCASL